MGACLRSETHCLPQILSRTIFGALRTSRPLRSTSASKGARVASRCATAATGRERQFASVIGGFGRFSGEKFWWPGLDSLLGNAKLVERRTPGVCSSYVPSGALSLPMCWLPCSCCRLDRVLKPRVVCRRRIGRGFRHRFPRVPSLERGFQEGRRMARSDGVDARVPSRIEV